MNELQIFKTVENETSTYPNGNTFTLSAICDNDGTFEITICGNGGTVNALKSIQRLVEIIKDG